MKTLSESFVSAGLLFYLLFFTLNFLFIAYIIISTGLPTPLNDVPQGRHFSMRINNLLIRSLTSTYFLYLLHLKIVFFNIWLQPVIHFFFPISNKIKKADPIHIRFHLSIQLPCKFLLCFQYIL